MAEKGKFEKKQDLELAKLIRELDFIYIDLANEIGSVGATYASSVDKDKPFSLSKYPLIKKRVDAVIKKLAKRLNPAIVSGIRSAWTLANQQNNELCNVVFGDRAKTLTVDQKRRYYTSNGPALDAFLKRKDDGLSLSQKVWNYSEECVPMIESTLELGIKTGESAAEIAKDLKTFPDKLFRRVRDKKTGDLHLSKAASEFHPGQGVYRSSYKNAQRLARTEVNMSYRTADHLRHTQLDFIVGIEIHLSNNHTCLGPDGKPHPFHDICDDLAGKYPKWFDFKGWHPQCRCFMTTILKTDEEIDRDLDGINRGSVNEVKTMPPQWERWLAENQDRVARAEASGKLPYFLRDNLWAWKEGEEMPGSSKSALVVAQERHAARTEEEIADIKRRWTERHNAYADARRVLAIADSIPDLEAAWGDSDWRTERLRKLREKYETGRGFKDYSRLSYEASIILDSIKELRDDLAILDNPLAVMRKWGVKTAYKVKDAVSKTMSRFEKMSDKDKIDKYRYEAKWIEENRKDTIPTWKEAQDAYLKAAKKLEWKVEWQPIKDEYDSLLKNPMADASLLEKAKAFIGKDKSAAKKAIKEITEDIELKSAVAKFEHILKQHPKLLSMFVPEMIRAKGKHDAALADATYRRAKSIVDAWDDLETRAQSAKRKLNDEWGEKLDNAIASDDYATLSKVLQEAEDEVAYLGFINTVHDLLNNHGRLLQNANPHLVNELRDSLQSQTHDLMELQRQIRVANDIIHEWEDMCDNLDDYAKYATKSKTYADLLAEAGADRADENYRGLKAKLMLLKAEKERLEKAEAWRAKIVEEKKKMADYIKGVKDLKPTDPELLRLISEYEANTGSSASKKKEREAYEAVKARADALGLKVAGGRMTLADWKAKMGAKFPKTLEKLEDTYKTYEKSGHYGTAAAQNKDEIEQAMFEWLDRFVVGTNQPTSVVEKILDSHFKNTFEVGDSGGYVGPAGDMSVEQGGIPTSHSRLKMSHKRFLNNTPYDSKHQLKRREYEKYGNLMDTDILSSLKHNPGGGYGQVQFRFKKNSVPATFTPEDSLGSWCQPSLVTDPKAYSFDDRGKSSMPLGMTSPSFSELFRKCIYGYCELQLHGDITPDLVESIAYPFDLMDKRHANDLRVARRWINEVGVKVYYIDSNGNLATL